MINVPITTASQFFWKKWYQKRLARKTCFKPKRNVLLASSRRGTWKAVSKESVFQDGNLLRGRFFIAIKDEGTKFEVLKAFIVVRGYRDRLKTSSIYNSATAWPHLARILLALTSSLNFKIFSTDVTQAYFQSAESLMRGVTLRRPSKLKLNVNKLVQLEKPLYGLFDSEDYLNRTIKSQLISKLGIVPTIADSAFIFIKYSKILK